MGFFSNLLRGRRSFPSLTAAAFQTYRALQ